MAIRMAMHGWTPKRRGCALCGRSEATSALHLASIMVDGVARRACDSCRSSRTVYFCQGCRAEQGGQRHHRGGLVLCAPCARAVDAAHKDASVEVEVEEPPPL
jgi:hypothetical protein